MVWKHDGKEIAVGSSFVDKNGFKHPSNWESSWSAKDKKDWGLVWENDAESFDKRFYNGRDAKGKLIEKSLNDVDVTDEKGNKVKDSDGVQLVNEGLKTKYIRETKEMCNNFLEKTDWYVVRKAEGGSDIPSEITTERNNLRNSCKTIEDKINACKSLSDFKKLFDAPTKDGVISGDAPINDWGD
tara:strand:- start:368 stop:922 length:555 start_codon:yes stop_codon:yes gene_type:complete